MVGVAQRGLRATHDFEAPRREFQRRGVPGRIRAQHIRRSAEIEARGEPHRRLHACASKQCAQQHVHRHAQFGTVVLGPQDVEAHAKAAAVQADLGQHAGLGQREVRSPVRQRAAQQHQRGALRAQPVPILRKQRGPSGALRRFHGDGRALAPVRHARGHVARGNTLPVAVRRARVARRQDLGARVEGEDFVKVPARAFGDAFNLLQQRGVQFADEVAIARAEFAGALPVDPAIGEQPRVGRNG